VRGLKPVMDFPGVSVDLVNNLTLGQEDKDAATFISWGTGFYVLIRGVDYLKYDNCQTFYTGYNGSESYQTRYMAMRDALLRSWNTSRPIHYSLCEWGNDDVWTWGNETGHSWRIAIDIEA
jgi:alpha-galactosidase